MKSNKEIILQVPLKGTIADMFEDIFNASGLESRTEYIRLLISKEYTDVKRPNT